MKIKTLDLMTTALKIHEQDRNNEYKGYKFVVKNLNCFIDKSRVNGFYVNCYSVIRVEDEEVETFTTSVWFDEDGNITDII